MSAHSTRRRSASACLSARTRAATCCPKTKAGEPGVALSASSSPKSATCPGHPLPELSQRVTPGLDTMPQSLHGLAPISKVPHNVHSANLRPA